MVPLPDQQSANSFKNVSEINEIDQVLTPKDLFALVFEMLETIFLRASFPNIAWDHVPSTLTPTLLQTSALGTRKLLSFSPIRKESGGYIEFCFLQDVAEFSTLLLRYKYYAFFDLNPKASETCYLCLLL